MPDGACCLIMTRGVVMDLVYMHRRNAARLCKKLRGTVQAVKVTNSAACSDACASEMTHSWQRWPDGQLCALARVAAGLRHVNPTLHLTAYLRPDCLPSPLNMRRSPSGASMCPCGTSSGPTAASSSPSSATSPSMSCASRATVRVPAASAIMCGASMSGLAGITLQQCSHRPTGLCHPRACILHTTAMKCSALQGSPRECVAQQ
jgi:hypothetical protein